MIPAMFRRGPAPHLRCCTVPRGLAPRSAGSPTTRRRRRSDLVVRSWLVLALRVDREVTPGCVGLVLVDRALMEGGRQRHAHGRGPDPRLDGGLARHQAAVEVRE